jgi:large subunit ribosomal protein L9
MKVLLCEDVKDLGWLGDIVEVSEGYARNYLLPQGLASKATESNIRALAKEKAKRAERRIQDHKRLEGAATAVQGAEAVLAARANEQGVLFGSVGAADIAGNLREQGFEVADEIVQLSENIKQVGTSEVTLKFADELTATVSVVVVAAGQEIAEAPPADTPEYEQSPVTKEGEDEAPASAPPEEPEQEDTKPLEQ